MKVLSEISFREPLNSAMNDSKQLSQEVTIILGLPIGD